MPSLSDLVVLSTDHRPILIVECKGGKETSPEHAAVFRRNLLAHGLLPSAPFYLLAYSTSLFLWKGDAEADNLPDFWAPANSLLRDYARSESSQGHLLSGDNLELVMYSWLDDLAGGIRKPKEDSEADQMLVRSGVLGQIRNGTVSSRLAL